MTFYTGYIERFTCSLHCRRTAFLRNLDRKRTVCAGYGVDPIRRHIDTPVTTRFRPKRTICNPLLETFEPKRFPIVCKDNPTAFHIGTATHVGSTYSVLSCTTHAFSVCSRKNTRLFRPGHALDASVGEAGHQRHKRSNKSSSGRNPASHHIRRVNTAMGLERAARSEPWIARRFDRKLGKHVSRPVRSGAGTIRVLTTLAGKLRGGIRSPTDPDEWTKPTAAAAQGRYQGSATWDGKLLRTGEQPWDANASVGEQGWQACVTQSTIVPHEENVAKCGKLWHSGGRSRGDAVCSKLECTTCWDNKRLVNDKILCSRFKHGAPPRASSGTGRWKGGAARTATAGGRTPRAWAVGDGAGEDVEIYCNRDARDRGLTGDGNVTLAKILYFFKHEGNLRTDSIHTKGPMMEWVLAYEYVTCGTGRTKKEDTTTKHPTYWLQGAAARPSVFPVDAIRRRVHMYHVCPVSNVEAGSDASTRRGSARWVCGLSDDGKGNKVWRHRYKLAWKLDARTQRDAYMLNEHWHSAFQDGVV